MTARSMKFSNSRILPGQGAFVRASMASLGIDWICSASCKTDGKQKSSPVKECRHGGPEAAEFPAGRHLAGRTGRREIGCRASLLVSHGALQQSGAHRREWSWRCLNARLPAPARREVARHCSSRLISPISSRNNVPWSAISKRPFFCIRAPVNAPFDARTVRSQPARKGWLHSSGERTCGSAWS